MYVDQSQAKLEYVYYVFLWLWLIYNAMHYNCIIDFHRIKKLLETKEIYRVVQKVKEKDLNNLEYSVVCDFFFIVEICFR